MASNHLVWYFFPIVCCNRSHKLANQFLVIKGPNVLFPKSNTSF